MASITFVVPGEPVASGTRGGAPAESPDRGVVKHSVRVGRRRGEGTQVRATATIGEDVVHLEIENGPLLILHPESARDLILAQHNAEARNRSGRTTVAADVDEIQVPADFQWRLVEQTTAARGGATRSRLGGVILKGFKIVTGAAKDVASDFLVDKAQSFVATTLVARVDAQVEEGVYRLGPKVLPLLKTGGEKVTLVDESKDASLVLVHGTFSNTSGTFSKLWTQHPALVDRLFNHYGNRVFALDHQTLGSSPIGNALTLVKALPKNARVHLVTHSRGGLVGEVLAHACARDASGLELFEGDVFRAHREQLAELIGEAKARDVQVERLVRVACPARGTLLASKRVDAYLSILKWSLELSGIPVVPAIIDFLNGVAQHRADPTKIPGLAAQIPDNPLVRWIHHVNQPIAGDLRVVAGDIAGDSITSWLKTLLADAFYWVDNDLVVQTRSMYGGTPRASTSTFVLDRGGSVSHFAYFANAQTAGAIVNGLIETSPTDFRTIGPRSAAGEDSSGTRARAKEKKEAKPRPDLPAVIIVPGIFGSHLKDQQGRVWLDWNAPNPLPRLALTADIEVDGLIEDFYGDLSTFLRSTHEVHECAYDWRRSIRTSAGKLREVLTAALDSRDATGQPVRILAHSSGALVVRALQLVDDSLWKRWLAHADARLVLLGPPNAGFWMPMQVLSGDDTLGGLLALANAPFGEQEARQILASFPGLIELQAGLLDKPFAQEPRWRELAFEDVRRVTESTSWHSDQLQRRTIEWGIPLQPLLDAAVDVRKELDRQQEGAVLSPEKIAVVVGRGSDAPTGYATDANGLEYVYAEPGDTYVTHESASLKSVTLWAVDGTHTQLPAIAKAFPAYLELLQHGRTGLLAVTSVGASSPTQPVVRKRPSRTPKAIVPPTSNAPLLGSDEPDAAAEDAVMLRVSVVNGDLSFVRQPLLLGHYRSSKLDGAEYVMDKLIGGAMAASLRKGQYPDSAGSHQVFINTRSAPEDPRQMPRPEAVVIVGLGEEGKLRPADLVRTIKQGVIAWAQRLSERRSPPPTFDVAATLIGSGGIGVSVSQSAQLIVKGVLEANQAIAADRAGLESNRDRAWPRVAQLSLIELYLDRATEAWRALRMTSTDDEPEFVLDETIETGQGWLPRPLDPRYRGANYDFIRAATHVGPEGESIDYTLDTKRARTESRSQPVQTPLLQTLIGEAADDQSDDRTIRRTLFRLLVPVDLEPFLTGNTDLQFEVDSGTAGIPWELIDDSDTAKPGAEPWAIRTKLLRKLRSAEFRAQVADADADASVLVIGEPECDLTIYPPLDGARKEALAVAAALRDKGLQQVVALTSMGDRQPGPNARTVISTLMQSDWRIVHIAAHGEPPEEVKAAPDPRCPQPAVNPRGVVLSNEIYLGPREINNMRRVPELVFVNCCYLAARDLRQLFTKEQMACEPHYRNNRAKFASGVAEALIKVGVRCVIAAGWAVEDDQAKVFAQTFYEKLMDRHRFIDAVAEARRAAHRLGGNTWAAYQCYGDPDWVFRQGVSDAQGRSTDSGDPDASIASARDLMLGLRTIAVKCEFQKYDKKKARDRIENLEKRFAAVWDGSGRVAESFAIAYAKAGQEAKAIDWYTKALQANDGGASVRAAEQRANLQVRLAWNAANAAHQKRELLKEEKKGDKKKASAAQKDLDHAKSEIAAAIKKLEELVAVAPSMERASLLGSAYKRLALIAAIEPDEKAEAANITLMRDAYEQAETIGLANHLDDLHYPALNRLAAEFALATGPVTLEAKEVDAIRAALDSASRNTPDFWNVVGQTELRVYEALSRGALGTEVEGIIAAYDDLHLRVQQQWMWSSVYDQARFVLPKYQTHMSAADAAAADRIIEHLSLLSGKD